MLLVLDEADQLVAAIDDASFEVNRALLEIAPGLADPLRAATRSNVMAWATANLRKPGRPVPPNLGAENLDFARDVVRHGFDDTILSGFRVSQNVAMEVMTDVAFRLTDDPSDLRELLHLASRSIFSYVEDTLDGISATIRAERAQLRDAVNAARAEAVALVLEGSPITEGRASQQLGYELARTHVGVVVWADQPPAEGALEGLVHEIARTAGVGGSLVLPVGPTTFWIWIAGPTAAELPGLAGDAAPHPGLRVAVGRPGRGLVGFRRSHQEALTAQRLTRRLPGGHWLTRYADVEVVALLGGDEDRARDFVTHTLGPLAAAPRELRETLRSYLREECSLTRTAEAQFAHRNTVAARLDRARDLLPHPLPGRTLEVGLALEVARLLEPSP